MKKGLGVRWGYRRERYKTFLKKHVPPETFSTEARLQTKLPCTPEAKELLEDVANDFLKSPTFNACVERHAVCAEGNTFAVTALCRTQGESRRFEKNMAKALKME